MGTVSDEAHLRSLLQHQNIDLQLMHYQYTGFEHYDIVHLVNSSFGIAAEKKAGLTIAFLGVCFVGVLSSLNGQLFLASCVGAIALGTDFSEENVFTCMLQEGTSFLTQCNNWKKSRDFIRLIILCKIFFIVNPA